MYNLEMKDFFNKCIELPEMGYYEYDWNRFISYFDPKTNKFYWASASGCSCNDFWDDIYSLGDFSVGEKNTYLKAAGKFAELENENIDKIRRAVFGL